MLVNKFWTVTHADCSVGTTGWQGDADSRVLFSVERSCRWLALDAQLQLDQFAPAAHLCCETTTGIQRFPLPMSLSGRVLEVIALPEDVISCWLQPLTEPGFFQIHQLKVTSLNGLQCWWRYFRRAAGFYWQNKAVTNHQLGLSWWRVLTATQECYRRIGQLRACAPEMPYAEWQQRFESLTSRQLKAVQQRLPELLNKHRLTLVVMEQGTSSESCWQRTLASIEQSLGLNAAAVAKLQCLLLTFASEVNVPCRLSRQQCNREQLQQNLLALAPNQPVLLVPAGATLAPIALCWWLEAFDASSASWLYSDHDVLDDSGQRTDPRFKPDWSLELARCSHYTGDTLLVTAEALLSSGWLEGEPPFEPSLSVQRLVLQLAELANSRVQHIPAILWHQAGCPAKAALNAGEVVQHLSRQGIAARVEPNDHGYLDIHYAVPEPAPLVTVVIPTRDMLHLLKPCVDSLLHDTDYAAIEVLIVDNQSSEPATLDYFRAMEQEPRVRVLRYDKPFNYSAINNFAVAQAQGELICLLNNDTEVIRPDWLCQMVGQLSQPGVGIVGARLLFADNRVQHAGDVIGVGGCATHLHFRLPANEPGYMGRAVLSQDLSAVTAACLLTPKALYQQLGGLNETELTVAFNDVDYCLKAREAGWRVLYTPLALLYHYESVSRGKDDNPEKQRRAAKEAAYMRKRWANAMQGDPFYNPNLNGTAADFRLSAAPRVSKPW